MEFCTLTEKEFDNFAKSHKYGSFHQNTTWGHLKELNGWKIHLVGVKDNGKIIAGSLILSKNTIIQKSMFYAPRGFLIDYRDTKLLTFFITNLKQYIKENKGIFLKFDPYVEYQERDISGSIVQNGYDNKYAVDNLINQGCIHHGFSLMMEDMQPRWIYVLETKDKTVDDVMSNMDAKTRQILRKNERMGLYIEDITNTDLTEFHKVMEETSSRRQFTDRPLSYYQNMVKEFSKKDEVMVYLCKFNHDNYINTLKENINTLNDEINKRNIEYNKNPKQMNIDKKNKKDKQNQDEIDRLNKIIETMQKSKEDNGNIINLGSILFFKTNNEVLSLAGGSYEKYMSFQSAYTTHFAGIKYATENNFDRYNFYGITGDFNKSNPLYGLYSFKKDFGGHVVELIGEFDLVVNKFEYTLYKVAYGIYHKLKQH